jgi:putative ABC transport system permease protein
MRLRNIVVLYRVRLRAKLAHELFAIAGIAVGVALLFASQIVRTSPDSSMRQLVDGVVGTMRYELAARGPEGFPESLLAEVRRLPGVRATIPLFQVRANLTGPAGQQPVELLSTDAGDAHLGGPLLRRFSTAQLNHQQALALPLELADTVGLSSLELARMQIGGRSIRVFIGAILFESDLGALAHSRFVFAPLAYAQRLAGLPGRLTGIFLSARAGREREVQAELRGVAAGRLNVEPANSSATLFNEAAAPSNQSAELFSVIGALVGFLFAINALMLTATLRRNLVEDLRLDGYSRRMIVEVLLFDALVLGALASLLGLALGDLLSVALFSANSGYLSFAFPIDAQRVVTWQSVALAIVGGLLAAFAGMLFSLRRALLARRLLGETRQYRRVGSGATVLVGELLCWTITLLALVVVPGAAIVGIVSLVVSLLLALPWLLDAALRLADLAQRSFGSTAAHLAAIELRSSANWSRTLAIAATGAAAVFGSVSVEGAQTNLQRGLDRTAHDLAAPADIWVTAAGAQNVLATDTFRTSRLAALARLPQVRGVGLFHSGFLDDGSRRVWVMAFPAAARNPLPTSQLVRGDLASAAARVRHGGWVVLSQGLAGEHNLRIGQSFVLPAPRPIAVRVAALSTNIGWPPGAIVMSAADYARAWPGGGASAYVVTLRKGVSPQQGRRAVRRALGGGAGLVVETRAERERRLRSTSRQALSRLTQITTLVLIAAVLAMTTAMGAMIWQRRPLLADMKVDGFHQAVLWRALLVESTLILGVGCSIGTLFGLCGQLLLSHALAVVTGFPVVMSMGAPVAIGSLLAVVGVAVAIVAVPGYLAARVRAAIVLQD